VCGLRKAFAEPRFFVYFSIFYLHYFVCVLVVYVLDPCSVVFWFIAKIADVVV